MTQSVDTVIHAVTVYRDQARIERQGSLTLAAGLHTLSVGSLPAWMDQHSVRAAGRGLGMRIISVDVRSELLTQSSHEQVAELEEQLDALTGEQTALADLYQVHQDQVERLKGLARDSVEEFAEGIAKGRTPLNGVTAFNDFIKTELRQAYDELYEVGRLREELDKVVESFRHELDKLRHGSGRKVYVVEVTVEVDAEAELTLEISYLVGRAEWLPQYDLRLEGDQLNLTYLASIRQRTGEDWPELALTLSTAQPSRSGDLPELSPWFIQPYHPPMPKRAAMMGRSASSANEDALMEFAVFEDTAAGAPAPAPQAPPPMEVAQAEVQRSGMALTYTSANALPVVADGQPRKVTILAADVETQLDYLCVPKLAEEAYLRALITNTSGTTLMPGDASVFHGADFVGRSNLGLIAPNEEFEVQLGGDDRIRVDRKLTKRETSRNLIGGKRRVT
ncbi:MAG: mucoidy inhibitor MuiA family protein, partial [Chloroflexi bacterium]|nr:mucoidy inhibitor MuiA family protein [Chloroflexota bacterium]